MKENKNTFWQTCEGKVKEEIYQDLSEILGKPQNEREKVCLAAISKKISSYYRKELGIKTSADTYFMFNQINEIQKKYHTDGPKVGQYFYNLKLSEPKGKITQFQAYKDLLSEENWQLIENSAILDRNFRFEYQKWLNNCQLLDFQTIENATNHL